MNLLLVQDHLRSGGAARAAGRWAGLLRNEGHRVMQAAGDEPGPDAVRLTGKPPRGIGRLWDWCRGARESRQNRLASDFLKLLQEGPWNLVWFHNLAGGQKWGWSEEMIQMARTVSPVLWTLHDMWALADRSESYWDEGSAAESAGRKGSRIERVCGKGGEYPVTMTAPSRWLAGLTRKMTGQECSFLPNPIDLAVFRPGDRQAARRQLGLREQGLVVLAGADSLQDPRKGFDLLREAWGRLPSGRATLALFGRHGESRPGEHYLGKLDSDEEMVAAYQSADLVVHPARMENAPCTIQESLACGTPVLAFSVGGIPEMIHPGRNGFLVEKTDGSALGEGLQNALGDPRRLEAMRAESRKIAESDHAPGALMEKFYRLYPGTSR
jgi:glycosyltransferase involved in cell wall biosynthesis